jgi:hypothetical protein
MPQAEGVTQFVQAQLNEAFQEDRPGRYDPIGVAPETEQGDDGGLAVYLALAENESQDGNKKVPHRDPQNSESLRFYLIQDEFQQLGGIILLPRQVIGLCR